VEFPALDAHTGPGDRLAHLRRDDHQVGAGGLKRRQLRRRNRAGPDDEDAPAVQLQERGKEGDDELLAETKKKARKAFDLPGFVISRALNALEHHAGPKAGKPRVLHIQQQQLHAQGFPERIGCLYRTSGRDRKIEVPPDLVVIVR
jgi:hypothetical protein